MYRINNLSISLLLLILSFSSISAQEVIITENGYPVIDLSALDPLGAVLSSLAASERRTLMNNMEPSKTDYLEVGSSECNGIWNARMSTKYQVMQADLGSKTDWVSAWNACSSYNKEDGSVGQWRLPTQRELQMIWILHPLLIAEGKFNANRYWSATEGSETAAWFVTFSDGLVGTLSKENLYYVRCVRDLP